MVDLNVSPNMSIQLYILLDVSNSANTQTNINPIQNKLIRTLIGALPDLSDIIQSPALFHLENVAVNHKVQFGLGIFSTQFPNFMYKHLLSFSDPLDDFNVNTFFSPLFYIICSLDLPLLICILKYFIYT